jgi:ATP-dependent DNA ligase
VLTIGDQDLRGIRGLSLLERKAVLVPDQGRLLRAKYIDRRGVDLFRAVCSQDLEGIVAKHKRGAYIDGHDGRSPRRHELVQGKEPDVFARRGAA